VSARNYLILCAAITVLLVVSLLSAPAFSDAVERILLAFLATSAR
jgi:hypothetical protein